MKTSLALVLIASFVLTPIVTFADGARAKARRPMRPSGNVFRLSYSAHRPIVKVASVGERDGRIEVKVSFRVRRGHVSTVELFLDGRPAGRVEVPRARSGVATFRLSRSAVAKGEHSLVAHAAQGRPGHQSIKGISKAARLVR